MNNENCAVCGNLMNLIPAGTSRTTGKPYNSFMACPNKCKQPTYQQAFQQNRQAFNTSYQQNVPIQPQATLNAPTSQISPANGTVAQPATTDWDSINKQREDGMKILNAKNIAGELTAMLLEKDFIILNDVKATFKEYCDYVFFYKPVEPAPILKDTRQLLVEQGFTSNKSMNEVVDDIKIEEIPFD